MPDIFLPSQLISPNSLDFSQQDQKILRDLAGKVASLAAQPIEAEKRRLWLRHNDLEPTRPVVFCDPEIGWGEIIRPEHLLCENPITRRCEFYFRQMVFWGTQMLDDRPIPPYFPLPYFHSEPFWGLKEGTHGGEDGGSYVWEAPVKSAADIEKLHYPKIQVDFKATKMLADRYNDIFGNLLPIQIRTQWWWTLGLTDILAKLRGLEQIMLDMALEPMLIHRLMSLLRDGTLAMLDELEAKGLLGPNFDATYVGSGGFGLVQELPQEDFNGSVRTRDMWGFTESQETVGISPSMFSEFVYPYQLPILERFGLNCYGCCEPLDKRWEIIKDAPRLRRVSVSPWAEKEKMARYLEDRYIYSLKPSPTDLAMEFFDEERIRTEIREAFRVIQGCRVEIIMKDVTTLRDDPQRAVQWTRIAREEAESL